MKPRLLLLIVGILLSAIVIYLKTPNLSPNSGKILKLTIASQILSVEVADTRELQTQGLSGRESLEQNSGMYFVFPDKTKRTIWMKDMKFPLDVIWLRDGSVVEITENLIPSGRNLPIITSREGVDAFLEIEAGFAKRNQVRVGQKVSLD